MYLFQSTISVYIIYFTPVTLLSKVTYDTKIVTKHKISRLLCNMYARGLINKILQ
jgi:hypothetical protein